MNRRSALGLILLAAIACRVPPDPKFHYLPALEPFNAEDPGWESSRPVLLISDSQFHNLHALPLPERNLGIEMFVGTAIRPPQLDLYSPVVLRWILEHGAPEADRVIHLGDASDLACEGELRQFLDVMKSARGPWLMVPGNHDCYHFGVCDPRNRAPWQDACHGAGEPITKERFIRIYVAALLSQDNPGAVALADSMGLSDLRGRDPFELEDRIPDRFAWEAPVMLDSFLRAIVWDINREKPWQSFVLQRANLSGSGPRGLSCQAILMDSCQYDDIPTLVPNAWDNFLPELNCAVTGELLSDQLRIVRLWVELAGYSRTILMCHHPVDTIASKSRSSLLWLWGRSQIGVVCTAHTHGGRFVHHDLNDGKDGLELNLGSTVDWPMEWRNLVLYARGTEAYIKSDRFTLVDILKNREGFFKLDWEIPLGAKDDYRTYRSGDLSGITYIHYLLYFHYVPPAFGRPKILASRAAYETEVKVKNTLLWTYHRLITTFPTDTKAPNTEWPSAMTSDDQIVARIEATAAEDVPIEEKIALIMELAPFEETRSTAHPESGQSTDEERLRYKLSQAVWASRYEKSSGRQLDPNDELIRVRIPKAPD